MYLILSSGYVILAAIWILTFPSSPKNRARELLKPRPLAYLLVLVLFLFSHKLPESVFGWNSSLDPVPVFLGVLLYLLGVTLATWAKVTMKKNWGLPAQHSIKTQKELVTSGPFAISRHPIYLGLVVMSLGYSLALRSYLILFSFLFFIYFNWAAEKEERLLTKYFGKSYLDYKRKVPRFLIF